MARAHDEMIANRLSDAREAGHRFEQLLQSCDQPKQLAALRSLLHELSVTASKLPEPLPHDDYAGGFGGMP
jgi:hypothetical protein